MPKSPVKPAPERRIFISYSRIDIRYVRALYARLALICADLPGNSANWLDCEQIKGGDEWELKTMQAIEDGAKFNSLLGVTVRAPAEPQYPVRKKTKYAFTTR